MDPPPAPPPSSSSSSAPSPTPSLPRLPLLPPSKTHPFRAPEKRIHTGADLPHFLSSLAYRDIGLFLLQLNRALCPRKLPSGRVQSFPLDGPRHDSEVVKSLRAMLARMEDMIAEAPPEKGPRRFGNVSFRVWCALLEERGGGLLREGLPASLWERWGEGAVQEVKGYLMGAFGSAQRLDYGTGHELSFLAFLGGLWKLGVFTGEGGEGEDGEVERGVVLGVFEP